MERNLLPVANSPPNTWWARFNQKKIMKNFINEWFIDPFSTGDIIDKLLTVLMLATVAASLVLVSVLI